MSLIRKRKKFSVIILLASVTILAVIWMIFNMMRTFPVRDVRILFGDNRYGVFTLFEFVEPQGFKVTWFTIDVGFYHEEVTFLDDFMTLVPELSRFPIPFEARRSIWINEIETFDLSTEELRGLQRLVEKVVRGGEDGDFKRPSLTTGNLPFVWAIIDGNNYWSFYLYDFRQESWIYRWLDGRRNAQDYRPYMNNQLLSLAYRLIDISPVPIGDEFNNHMFTTPEPLLRYLLEEIRG